MKYVGNNLDILTVLEIKKEDTLSESRFLIESFHRLVRTAKDGKMLLHLRKDIPSE